MRRNILLFFLTVQTIQSAAQTLVDHKGTKRLTDTTADSWKNDNANSQVRLAYASDGTTSRPDTAAFVIKDNGRTGIGLTNPAGILDMKGRMYVNNQQTLFNAGALNSTNFTGSLYVGDGGQNGAAGNTYNTSLGISAMLANTTGSGNTAVGYAALFKSKTSSGNTALGYASLYNNTTSSNNTAVGYGALRENTTGSYNTALGYNALEGNSTSDKNTALGYWAGHYVTGANNTFVGYLAGEGIQGGNNNIVLGGLTQGSASLGITNGSYNTIIGTNVANVGNISNNIILADGQGNRRINVDSSGKTGIGTATPSATLEVNGNMEIATVAQVANDNNYAPLVLNTITKRVESVIAENVKRIVANVAAGSTSSAFYTLQDDFTGAYEIKIYSYNTCGQAFYNKFFIAGANFNSTWSISYVGGVSPGNGSTPSAADPSAVRNSQGSITVTNPTIGCADGGNGSSFTYTLSVNQGTGALSIQNNGNISKDYNIHIEKAFD